MTVVLGIDPSMSGTGLAVWRDGVVTVRTVATAPARHASTPAELLDDRIGRWRYIVGEVHTELWSRGDHHAGRQVLAVVENVVPGAIKSGAIAIQLMGLHALLLYGLHARDVNLVLVEPSQLKLYALGKGSGPGTDKLAMVRAADKRLPDYAVANDNEADALWLLAMGLHHHGQPLADMPAKHTEALSKVAWRPFTLPPKEGTHA